MKKNSRSRPTMTDVAKVAGVSQSSVSLVLNEMTGARLSEATRNKVRQAAESIGYRLPADRRLASGQTARDTFAFVIDEISTSPHPVVCLDGVRDYAFEQGCLVTTYVTRSNVALEQMTLQAIVADSRVAGVIYATVFTREITVPSVLKNIPTVLLNCYSNDNKHISVQPGEVTGGFNATRHLLDLGHRRIGFINGEEWMDAAQDRLRGYKRALASDDIPFDESIIYHCDWLPLQGYQSALRLLKQRNPPTAILCGNDLMAIGAVSQVVLGELPCILIRKGVLF